jgi:predicted glycosyltransferase
MTRPTVLFYCQHSLGMGHLVRSLALASALGTRSRVILLNGGPALPGETVPPGVQVVQLPPVGMEGRALVSRDGRRGLDRALAVRRQRLLAVFQAERPDVLLVELFPFGRKKFADELLPLLEAARARGTLTVCSLRDILVSGRPSQAAHDERACQTANDFFDAVLVHADPRFARLEESFRPSTPLRVPVHYTGFVVPFRAPALRPARPASHVLVSVGGGMAGVPLVEAAVGAHRLLASRGASPGLRIVAGPFYPEPEWRSLRAAVRACPGMTLRRQVPDLVAEMRRSLASVSQCGYNTALDLLQAGVPGLVVPFGNAAENEQMDRARRLERAGALQVLEPERLRPEALAGAIEGVLRFRPAVTRLDLGGARWTAEWIAGAASREVVA